jgi:hypothetical protein
VLADGFGPGLVATSPDGRLLAYTRVFYQQKEIYLWDLEHGADLGWLGREDQAAVLLFSPDSKQLAVGSSGYDWEGNQTPPRLAVYTVDLDAWRASACRIAARELTAEEWSLYLGNTPRRTSCAGQLPVASTGLVAAEGTPVRQQRDS